MPLHLKYPDRRLLNPARFHAGVFLAPARWSCLIRSLMYASALSCATGFVSSAAPTLTQPVSVPGLPVISGAGSSFIPTFSANGQFVAFVSQANNLVTNDDLAPSLDVFLRDVANHKTSLVSVNSTGTGGGDGDSNFPTVSSNGQFVAFES